MSDEFKAFMCAILKVAELIASKTENETDDRIVAMFKFFLRCE